jgi:hypothetical protein
MKSMEERERCYSFVHSRTPHETYKYSILKRYNKTNQGMEGIIEETYSLEGYVGDDGDVLHPCLGDQPLREFSVAPPAEGGLLSATINTPQNY